jgi:uncharacterized membrane protein YqjE
VTPEIRGNVFPPTGKGQQVPPAPNPDQAMNLIASKFHAIVSGLVFCALGLLAIQTGDHHVELPFRLLVALGVAMVLAGLILLRYSWAIRERR